MNPYSYYPGFYPQQQNLQKIYNLHVPGSSHNNAKLGLDNNNNNNNNNSNANPILSNGNSNGVFKSPKTLKNSVYQNMNGATSNQQQQQQHQQQQQLQMLKQNIHKIYNLHLPSDLANKKAVAPQIKSSKSSKAILNLVNTANPQTTSNNNSKQTQQHMSITHQHYNQVAGRHQSQPIYQKHHAISTTANNNNNTNQATTPPQVVTKYTVPKLPQIKNFPSFTTNVNGHKFDFSRGGGIGGFDSKLVHSKSAIDLSATYKSAMAQKGKPPD